MNNENNNNQNNYVTPEKVDFSKVTLTEHQDNFLNRERDNIVNATIQANEALDKKQATDVNNAIKVEKKNPVIRFLVILFLLVGAGLITFFAVKISKDFIESGKETETTTTTVKVNKVSKYLNDTKKARKFKNGDNYILLSPKVSGLPNYYIYITTSNDGLIKQELGTYNIENNVLSMFGYQGEERALKVGDSAMVTDGTVFEIYDDEMKFYVSENAVLILNGSVKNEIALFATSEDRQFISYKEDQTTITLNNGYVFQKKGNTVEYNGIILSEK